MEKLIIPRPKLIKEEPTSQTVVRTVTRQIIKHDPDDFLDGEETDPGEDYVETEQGTIPKDFFTQLNESIKKESSAATETYLKSNITGDVDLHKKNTSLPQQDVVANPIDNIKSEIKNETSENLEKIELLRNLTRLAYRVTPETDDRPSTKTVVETTIEEKEQGEITDSSEEIIEIRKCSEHKSKKNRNRSHSPQDDGNLKKKKNNNINLSTLRPEKLTTPNIDIIEIEDTVVTSLPIRNPTPPSIDATLEEIFKTRKHRKHKSKKCRKRSNSPQDDRNLKKKKNNDINLRILSPEELTTPNIDVIDIEDSVVPCSPIRNPTQPSIDDYLPQARNIGFHRLQHETLIEIPDEVENSDHETLTQDEKIQKAIQTTQLALKALKDQELKKTGFIYTPIIRKLPHATTHFHQSLHDNRSPLHALHNISFNFNQQQSIDFREYGLEMLSPPIARISKALGINANCLHAESQAYMLRNAQRTKTNVETLEKSIENKISQSFLNNVAVQTDQVIVRQNVKTIHSHIQVQPDCKNVATQATSSLYQHINSMNSQQIQAVYEFVDIITDPNFNELHFYSLRERIMNCVLELNPQLLQKNSTNNLHSNIDHKNILTQSAHQRTINQTHFSLPIASQPAQQRLINQNHIIHLPTESQPAHQITINHTHIGLPTESESAHQRLINQNHIIHLPTESQPAHQRTINQTHIVRIPTESPTIYRRSIDQEQAYCIDIDKRHQNRNYISTNISRHARLSSEYMMPQSRGRLMDRKHYSRQYSHNVRRSSIEPQHTEHYHSPSLFPRRLQPDLHHKSAINRNSPDNRQYQSHLSHHMDAHNNQRYS